MAPEIVEGIRRVRAGELNITPGYDGQYGQVHVYSDNEKRMESDQQST